MSDRVVTLGHGSGGRLTHELVRDLFLRRFDNEALSALGDSAVLPAVDGHLAFTTDGFVVSPIVFAGGDIGALAVNGTVNDLSVAFAVPLHLSVSFILEEGFSLTTLEQIADSMARAARQSGVRIVTGDTKVVERGHGDGVFISTAGIGRMRHRPPTGPRSINPGDAVLVSGSIGDHGAVIAAHRSGLEAGQLKSDCAPVLPLAEALSVADICPRILRDPTRGGLATVLAELADEAQVTISLNEVEVPIQPGTRTVCEILGLDPLYLACEGRLVAIVAAEDADRALTAMRGAEGGSQAAIVGEVSQRAHGPVLLRTRYGGSRLYETLASEQLPRIC